MSGYLTVKGPGESEYVEKRSSFLGHTVPVETEEEAREFISAQKKKYHDAKHNCWCYIIKDGPERYSDDGEPQGTAGIPMMEVFKKEGITNVVCVVTRYFGGVLLGAGGLLRAYTKAAKDSLDDAGIYEVKAYDRICVRCSYANASAVKTETEKRGGKIEDTVYEQDVCLKVSVPEGGKDAYIKAITDITAGKTVFEDI